MKSFFQLNAFILFCSMAAALIVKYADTIDAMPPLYLMGGAVAMFLMVGFLQGLLLVMEDKNEERRR